MLSSCRWLRLSALSSTATWDDTTFSKLGVTPGTYQWTLGSGEDEIFFTLNIGGVVPEPSIWAMMLLGFAALGLLGWHGSRRIAHTA